MKKTAVITTTINMPLMLEDCCKNASFYNHKNIEFFIIGDKKTPEEVPRYCKELSSKYSYDIHYLGIDDQEKALKDYPKLLNIFPYNDANRKHLGVIIAYIQGFDVLIMLDDDNYPTNHDFFGHHNIVGTEKEILLAETPSGWFNTSEYLIEENNMPFYYRGFPWSQRKIQKELVTMHHAKAKVVVNSGFWLDDPDVDAVTRLFWPIRVTGMKKEVAPNFGLFPGTWCPFNNQNTAITRDILPAYFTPPTALRFCDLFPAFVVCRIAEHLKHIISYGFPFVRQHRNPHNLWDDIEKEIIGAQASETLIQLLRSATLTGNNYHNCLEELNTQFEAKKDVIKKCPKRQREMLLNFIEELKIYHEAFDIIQKR